MSSTKQLIPNNYRLTMAEKFVQSFTDASNSVYYVFAGRNTSYANSDTVIPSIINSTHNSEFDAYQKMVFAKHVLPTDVAYLAKRYDWTANTVYQMFDDDLDLSSSKFYVSVNEGSNWYIYKCLYNANGSPSTSQPTFADTSASDTFYQTADGYQWRYLYQLTSQDFTKWATEEYIPVIPDANVVANAVPGAIDVCNVSSGGSGYDNYVSGQFNTTDIFSSNNFLYAITSNGSGSNGHYTNCVLLITGGTGQGQYESITSYTVNSSGKFVTVASPFPTTPSPTSTYDISPSVVFFGDGGETVEATGRALINAVAGNSVYRVEMLSRGMNYRFANAFVLSAPVVGVSNVAVLRPIIGPLGGHGSNVYSELLSSRIGISVTFANSESNTIPTQNDYRQVGIIKDPRYSNVTILTANATGDFTLDEVVIQSNTGARGTVYDLTVSSVSLTNAYGFFAPGNTTVNQITGQSTGTVATANAVYNNDAEKGFETFNAMNRYVGVVESGSFIADEVVSLGNVAVANAIFHSFSNTTVMAVTEQLGTFSPPNTIQGTANGGFFSIAERYPPDIIPGSGAIIYLENVQPRSRSNTQSETVKLILTF